MNRTRWILVTLSVAAVLAGCGKPAVTGTAPRDGAIAAQATPAGRDKVAKTYLDEYARLDWNYYAERKQLLMGVVSQLMAGTNTPCTTSSVTPAQRDAICQTYLDEYSRLDWNYYADRKKLLVDMFASTGSDVGLTALSDEYARLDWNYYADRKRLLMDAIAKAMGVPTVPCDTRQGLRKPSAARLALAKALAKDLDAAPKGDRAELEKLIKKAEK